MVRLTLGFIKGLVIGGGVGYGAHAAGLPGGLLWLVYGAIGVLVGLLVGRPLWRHLRERGGTVWTPVLKSLFGFGVAVGLYALAVRVWGGFSLDVAGETVNPVTVPFVLGGAIGAVYGAFVEVDDSVAPSSSSSAKIES